MSKSGLMVRPRFGLSLASALAASLALAGPGYGITTTWNQLVDGNFLDAGNWDNGLPGAADSANFNNEFTGTVEFSSTYTTQDLFLQNTSGVITLDVDPDDNGNIYTATRFVIVGASAGQTNHLIQTSGEIVTGIFFLGNADGSDGNQAEITGPNTILRGTGGASGTVSDIRVGSNGGDNSSLTISNGATVESSTTTIIGLQGANNGQLIVTDPGTSFSTNSLQLGDNTTPLGPQTNNNASFLNGATATVNRFIVGVTAPSPNNTLTVSGPGTVVTLDLAGRDSDIGRSSTGNSLIINNGGRIDGGAQFVVGREASSTGNLVSVTGGGQLIGTSIEVLRGNLLVDGGSVEFTELFDNDPLVNAFVSGELLAKESGDSQVEFKSGSIVTVAATVTNGSPFSIGDGVGSAATYQMKPSQNGGNGTHTFTDGLFLNSNAVLSGSGDIVANVSAAAGASVDIGTSPGLITVTGNWDNTGVTITAGLDDLSASQDPGVDFDQLDITGAFTHGGGVVIDVSDLVLPGTATSIKVLGWTSQVGSSATTSVSFTGGGALAYSFLANGLFVDIPAGGIEGDLNGDGFVGIADLNIVLGAWNQNVPPGDPLADPSGDGFVGIADLNVVLGNWNAGTPPTDAAAVPEPVSAVVFTALGLMAMSRRRTV
ncbi:MAG: hypothetical protein R3C45_07120 [Phycisphaerales bacterium]